MGYMEIEDEVIKIRPLRRRVWNPKTQKYDKWIIYDLGHFEPWERKNFEIGPERQEVIE
jgi:hypothetical protein